MWLFWWMRGQVTVGRRSAEQCLAADLPAAIRGRVHLTAATMCYAAGDVAAAAGHWGLIGESEGDAELACKALAGTGLAALAAGDLAAAASRFEAALPATLRAAGAGIWMASLVHVWLGTVRLLQGDAVGAVAQIERGLEIARSRGDRLSTYVALYNLTQCALASSDSTGARRHLAEGIELSGQTQDLSNLAYFLEALAVVEGDGTDPRRVAVLLGAAQALRERVGANVYGYYQPDESLRADAARRAGEALGRDRYDDAVDQGRALEPSAVVAYAVDDRHSPR